MLRETGTGGIAGPKALQKVSRGVVHFAACQKATETAETMVCLCGHSGLREVGWQSLLLLLHPIFYIKRLIKILYFLLKLEYFLCLCVCLLESFWSLFRKLTAEVSIPCTVETPLRSHLKPVQGRSPPPFLIVRLKPISKIEICH